MEYAIALIIVAWLGYFIYTRFVQSKNDSSAGRPGNRPRDPNNREVEK